MRIPLTWRMAQNVACRMTLCCWCQKLFSRERSLQYSSLRTWSCSVFHHLVRRSVTVSAVIHEPLPLDQGRCHLLSFPTQNSAPAPRTGAITGGCQEGDHLVPASIPPAAKMDEGHQSSSLQAENLEVSYILGSHEQRWKRREDPLPPGLGLIRQSVTHLFMELILHVSSYCACR